MEIEFTQSGINWSVGVSNIDVGMNARKHGSGEGPSIQITGEIPSPSSEPPTDGNLPRLDLSIQLCQHLNYHGPSGFQLNLPLLKHETKIHLRKQIRGIVSFIFQFM